MKKIIHIAIFFLVFSACTDQFEELNIDPNRPVHASSPSILLNAQRLMTRTFLDNNDPFVLLRWVQYHAVLGYDNQPFNFDWNTDNIFNNLTSALNNMELLRLQAIEDNHVNYEAAAMIMKVWIFANATDLYGDIPYSEALQGAAIVYPKFDTQESIYIDLVKKLKEAESKIVLERQVADMDGGSDIFCQGDMLKWKKFSNSLRARLYLRMSEANGEVAKAGLEEIFGDPATYPVIDDNDYNVGVQFIEEADNENTAVFVQQANNGTLRSASSTIVDLLCANNDPRRTILLNATDRSIDSVDAGMWSEYVYRGAPPVIADQFTTFEFLDISTVGDDISFDYQRPIDVLTYAEVLFIQAEAASKGYDVGGTAEDFYNQGIEASMLKWGVSDRTLIDQYLAEPFVVFQPAMALEQILTQRYIDQFQQGINTFAMVRRGGYPRLKWINVGFAIDYGFPDRVGYAFNFNTNPNLNSVLPQVTQNLWGNLWFAEETSVNTAAAYEAPAEYMFNDN